MARAIDYLVRTYPEKTGKEILELYQQELDEDKNIFNEENKALQEIIADYNKNGAYFKGTFGLDQYFAYNCTDFVMEKNGNVVMDVQKIVIFANEKKEANVISVKLGSENYQNYDTYGLSMYERITKKEFDEIASYILDSQTKFWKTIKFD